MLETIDEQGVRELRLARPPVNALDTALIESLADAVQSAPAAGARAIVLSGQPGIFSAGLDVPALLRIDRAGMRGLFEALGRAQEVIARSPVPVIAAITGHAPAGGTVLVLHCDYRVMAEGPFTLGLNEVAVGLTPGALLHHAYARLVGEGRAGVLLTRGAMLDPQYALACGLVDEICAPADVVPRAHAYAQQLLALPSAAMRATRDTARAALIALFDEDDGTFADSATELWFSAETQVRLKALFAKK
ncbi:MAG TPA: enoyl-CoA hydratase/isomerase family protein [Steroidobacteraceae bacterium]|nr:enoyl-CoA hydratase/isomerase family protein [Steroidobacteraceae bacterium]